MRHIGIITTVMLMQTLFFSSCINQAENRQEMASNPKSQKIRDRNLTEEDVQNAKGVNDSMQPNIERKNFKYENDESYLSVYKKPLDNGNYCEFFIINAENGYVFMTYNSAKNEYRRVKFGDEYMDYGVPELKGFSSPDGKYVYAIGNIKANSTGWINTFQIYQIDTSTQRTKFVKGVAAWRMEKDGFTVASETRCVTPDAQFSAEMDFAFEDITYDFDGKVQFRSKEYPSKEIKKRYKVPEQRSV